MNKKIKNIADAIETMVTAETIETAVQKIARVDNIRDFIEPAHARTGASA